MGRVQEVSLKPSALDTATPFSEATFAAQWHQRLEEGIRLGGFRALALGASGGLDSAVCAALSMPAAHCAGVPVLAVQMIDRRVAGEKYNPDLYERLGAELIRVDITAEVQRREQALRLPPHWWTVFGLNILARLAPMPLRWTVVCRAKQWNSNYWIGRHYQRLLVPHRVRKDILQRIARGRQAAVIVCANRTELELGYFVEGGIDDATFGQWAPLAQLYKFQVRRLGAFLRLPVSVLQQSPSPGFGGVRDEHLLGPYPLVDMALIGFHKGLSESALLRVMRDYVRAVDKRRARHWRSFIRPAYVRYLRCLWQLNASKQREEKPQAS